MGAAFALLSNSVTSEQARAPELTFCNFPDTMERYACLSEAAARGASAPDFTFLPAYKALAVMQTVRAVANSARYSFWSQEVNFQVPDSQMQHVCLDEGFGICGNHMLLFVDLMERLGVPARTVEMYYVDPETGGRVSHAAAEFEFDGKWRYVDITWGSIWLIDRKLEAWLGLDDVLAGRGQRKTSSLDPWYFSRSTLFQPFSYIEAKPDVVRGGVGSVSVPFNDVSGFLVADLANVPKYFGDNRSDGRQDKLELRLPAAGTQVAVTIGGVGGLCTRSRVAFEGQTAPVSKGVVTFDSSGGGTLAIQGDEDVCYAVVTDIRFITKTSDIQ